VIDTAIADERSFSVEDDHLMRNDV